MQQVSRILFVRVCLGSKCAAVLHPPHNVDVQEGIDSAMVLLLSHEQLKELGLHRVGLAGRV